MAILDLQSMETPAGEFNGRSGLSVSGCNGKSGLSTTLCTV
jgi:hypothetical protein